MSKIERIEMSRHSIAISRDLRMDRIANQWRPEAPVDGLHVGVADMTRDPPHGGEHSARLERPSCATMLFKHIIDLLESRALQSSIDSMSPQAAARAPGRNTASRTAVPSRRDS